MKRAKDVDKYIAGAPEEIRGKSREMRAAIKSVVPEALEKISYGMLYYGYKGRLAYFAYFKNHIGLYIPTPIVEEYKKELKDYETAAATIRFPLDSFPSDKKLPIALIKKLVKARMKKNEQPKWKNCSRGHRYQGSGPCPICWPGRKKKK